MAITSSEIIRDEAQADGRRYITEEHEAHTGEQRYKRYLVDASATPSDNLAVHATEIEAQLDEEKQEGAMDRVMAGEAFLTITWDHTTAKKAARKIIRYCIKHWNPHMFLFVEDLMDYLIATYTNAQIANYLDITLEQAGRLKVRYNTIKAEKSFLEADEARMEDFD